MNSICCQTVIVMSIAANILCKHTSIFHSDKCSLDLKTLTHLYHGNPDLHTLHYGIQTHNLQYQFSTMGYVY
jgi:hypothetical protein